MGKHKYYYFFAFTFIVIALLNVLTGYINISSQEYVSYGSVSIRKSMLRNAGEILSGYDYSEYPQAAEELNEEYSFYSEYADALEILSDKPATAYSENSPTRKNAKELVSRYNISEGQVQAQMNLLDFCIERLNYANGYSDYISFLNSNITDISDVGIFGNDVKKQAVKAKNDFYGLDDISISAEPDISVNLLFSDRITDVLVIVMSVVCAVFYSIKCRSGVNANSVVKSRAFVFSGLLVLGIAFVYLSNIYIINSETGLGDLSRSIQSVSEYRSCPYAISVGTMIIIRTVFKISACAIIYLLCTKILLTRSKISRMLCIVLPVAAELILHFVHSRICFTALFRTESIIGKYNNFPVFGEYISSSVIISLMCTVLLLVAVILAKKETDNTLLIAKEQAEKRYYDEINTKYTEARMLRHDMRNHLTAIAILLDDGKVSDARMYLKEISSEMDSSRLPMKTGLPVLDALLFKKIGVMKKSGIEPDIAFEANLSETGISEYDLCSVFGNILDNACEACNKLTDKDKTVTMTVKCQMDMLCIFCENRYMDINEDLSTQKQDKKHHGIGLRSIRRIAEKYDGTLDINFEDGIFRLSVLLNLNKN